MAIFQQVFDDSLPYLQTFFHITSNGGQIGNIKWSNSTALGPGVFRWCKSWKTVQFVSERQMRDFKTPFFSTLESLKDFLECLSNAFHDYGTAVYAMSIAAEAAFNYISSVQGSTGFMASLADLDFIKRTRRIEGDFAIVTDERYLYPQYAYKEKETSDMLRQSAAKKALEKLRDVKSGELNPKHVHPSVLQHWKSLVSEWTTVSL